MFKKTAKRGRNSNFVLRGNDAPITLYKPRHFMEKFISPLVNRVFGVFPIVVEQTKVALTVLVGIVLPLVGLLCSIVILSDGKEN